MLILWCIMTFIFFLKFVLTLIYKIFIRLMCELLCSFSWWSIEGKSKRSSSYEELFLLSLFFYQEKKGVNWISTYSYVRGWSALARDLRDQMLYSRRVAIRRRRRSAVLDVDELHLARLDLDDHGDILAGGQFVVELLIILV